MGTGQSHNRSYDAAGLLASFGINGDTRTLAYDALNNIKGVDDEQINQDFVYDYLDRLVEAQSTGSNSAQTFDLAYSYDANSNRTTAEIDGTQERYTIESTSNRLIGVDGVAKSYDANGNLVESMCWWFLVMSFFYMLWTETI